MITALWAKILLGFVVYALLSIPTAMLAGQWIKNSQVRKPPQKDKAKKSRRQRKTEREIFRRAVDAGASEAEARKAVRAYTQRRSIL